MYVYIILKLLYVLWILFKFICVKENSRLTVEQDKDYTSEGEASDGEDDGNGNKEDAEIGELNMSDQSDSTLSLSD